MKYFFCFLACFLFSCANPQEERFENNKRIGKLNFSQVDLSISHCPITLEGGFIRCRAQSPNLFIQAISQKDEDQSLSIILDNMPQKNFPTSNHGNISVFSEPGSYELSFTVLGRQNLLVEVNGFGSNDSYQFGTVGDIQGNEESGARIVQDVSSRNLDFFIVIGDFVEDGSKEQYEWAMAYSKKFPIPLYAVLGNHDGFNDGTVFFERLFGKTDYSFLHNADLFLILDSANQGISESVFDFASETLSYNGGHKFIFMHVGPFDPFGMRNNGFNSRILAARFQNLLIKKGATALFSGHTHSYLQLEIDGVKNFIIGTGGGWPEKLDRAGFGYMIVKRNPSGVNYEFVDLGKD